MEQDTPVEFSVQLLNVPERTCSGAALFFLLNWNEVWIGNLP